MRNTKKPTLKLLPHTPEVTRAKVSQPARTPHARPRFDGTKPSPEVSRALRRVMRAATPDTRQPREATGFSHLQMFLWTVVVLFVVSALAVFNKPQEAKPATRTYSLDAPR